MQNLMPVIVFSICATVQADALADLKSALARLAGRQTVVATFDVSRSRHAKGRFLTQDFDGTARFDAEMSAGEVRVSFPRDTIERANDEQWLVDVNPTRTAPTWQALEEVIPQSVERALDFSKPLVRLIARGTLVEQRSDPLDGRPARALVFRLPNRTGGDRSIGSFTISEDVLTVWIDGDGAPVATRRVRKGSAGILLLRVDMLRTENATYAVHADHLVTMKSEDAAVIDGPGSQKGNAKSTWQVREVAVR